MPGPRYIEMVRVSSQGQAARETPEDQRAALDRLRKSRPGVLVERIEEAVSGAKDLAQRPDLRRLADLAAARAFDEVRVRHLDRLTRHADPGERSAILAIVYRAGAVIVDAGGTVLDPRTMAGELVWVVQTLGASEERKKIAERTAAGKKRLAAEGRLVGGRPPFGRRYDKAKGWSVDPEEAEVYRGMFAACLAGRSLLRIAGDLNRRGIPTPQSRGEWASGSVSHLLSDPAAHGHYEAHGHATQIPPIVTRETWEAARAKRRGSSCHSGPRPRLPALLRRLLTCGVCGSTMYVQRGGKRFGRVLYYVCASKGPKCRTHHRVESVDAAAQEAVRAFLGKPASLRAGLAADAPADDVEALERAIRAARREIKKIDAEEERLARLTTKGLVSEARGEKLLAEIRDRREAAERTIAEAQALAASSERRAAARIAIEEKLAALREGIGRATFAEWRGLMEVVFPREPGLYVKIHPDGQIRMRGAVALDDLGAAAVENAAKPPRLPRGSWQFAGVPVDLAGLSPVGTQGRKVR